LIEVTKNENKNNEQEGESHNFTELYMMFFKPVIDPQIANECHIHVSAKPLWKNLVSLTEMRVATKPALTRN